MNIFKRIVCVCVCLWFSCLWGLTDVVLKTSVEEKNAGTSTWAQLHTQNFEWSPQVYLSVWAKVREELGEKKLNSRSRRDLETLPLCECSSRSRLVTNRTCVRRTYAQTLRHLLKRVQAHCLQYRNFVIPTVRNFVIPTVPTGSLSQLVKKCVCSNGDRDRWIQRGKEEKERMFSPSRCFSVTLLFWKGKEVYWNFPEVWVDLVCEGICFRKFSYHNCSIFLNDFIFVLKWRVKIESFTVYYPCWDTSDFCVRCNQGSLRNDWGWGGS
jgi:hypothetical protein